MTKKEIIESTAPLFFSTGFKTLTMDDISSELGISKKTLYSFFAKKEDLISEVLRHNSESIDQLVSDIKAEKLNAIEQMFAFKNRVQNEYNMAQNHHCILQLKRYYTRIYKSKINKKKESMRAHLSNNLKYGKVQGFYLNSIEEEKMSAIFMITQTSLKEYDEKITIELDNQEIAELHFLNFMRGICTDKGRVELEKQLQKFNIA